MEELFPWLFGGGTILFIVIVTICSVAPVVAIFGGLGYFFYKGSKRASAERVSSQSWRQTFGTILKSRVEVTGGDLASVNARVIYQYEVHGQQYQSEQIRVGDSVLRIANSRDAYDTVDRYPVGAEVTVYYNPANPSQAALER